MDNSREYIQSLSRGLSTLSLLSRSSSPLGLTELSKELHLSLGTIQRIVYTLQDLAYIERDKETKKYRLGTKSITFALAAIRDLDLRKLALPFLEQLYDETGELIDLAILDGTEIVYMERIEHKQIITINLRVGSRLASYCTALGKTLLAFLPEERLEEVIEKMDFVALTPRTITNKKDFRMELETIRTRGFGINNEELVIGLRSVAAPVKDHLGNVIAAVSISVPSNRLSLKELKHSLAMKVIETADRISVTLGYKKDSTTRLKNERKPSEFFASAEP